MSAAKPAILASGGAGPLGLVSFGTTTTGFTSASILAEIWNQKGDPTADAARELQLTATVKTSADAAFESTSPPIANGYLEARITGIAAGGTGSPSPQVTGWQKIRPGRPLRLDPIPGDSGRKIEFRQVVPIGQNTDAWVWNFSLRWQEPTSPIPEGLWSAGQRGVFSGTGDGDASFFIFGGALTASGSPDNNIHLADLAWRYRGVPHVALAQAIPFDQHDGAGATLAAGQAYWLALTAGAGSGLTVTKGLAATFPVPITGRPALPAGEILVGFVQVPQTAAIVSGDIDQTVTTWGGWLLYGAVGLTAKLGPGSGIVGDSVDLTESAVSLTFPDNSSVSVWKVPANPDIVIQAAKPDPQALELWRVTTLAGAITVTKDVRRWIGPERERTTLFLYGGSVGTEVSMSVLPGPGDRALTLPTSIVLRHMLDATATGTAGFDLAYWNGSAWVTLFTSFATQDRRPAVTPSAPGPNAGPFYSAAALPEVLVLPGFTPIRFKHLTDTTPSVGTTNGVFLDLWTEAT